MSAAAAESLSEMNPEELDLPEEIKKKVVLNVLVAISSDFHHVVATYALVGCFAYFLADLPKDVLGQKYIGEKEESTPLDRGGCTSRYYLDRQNDQTEDKDIQH
jgi:hypothetical protein